MVDLHNDEAIKATEHMTSFDDRAEDEELGEKAPSVSDIATEIILKLPHLTVIYWCEKMTATTFGKTFADYFSQTLGLGYSSTAAVLISVFAVSLGFQLYVTTYWPAIFWCVMATSSIAGTLISDFIDRTLGWGYPLGTSRGSSFPFKTLSRFVPLSHFCRFFASFRHGCPSCHPPVPDWLLEAHRSAHERRRCHDSQS